MIPELEEELRAKGFGKLVDDESLHGSGVIGMTRDEPEK